MSAEVIVLLAAVGLLVGAIAVVLIIIAYNLRQAVKALGLITFGIRAIAHRVEPIAELTGQMRDDLTIVDDALAGVLESRAREEVG